MRGTGRRAIAGRDELRGRLAVLAAAGALIVAPATGLAPGAEPTASAEGGVPSCDGRVATVVGTAGDDRGATKLRGSADDDVIAADGGDDVVSGRGGDDVICLMGGADAARGGPGDDVVLGGGAEDRIAGGGGADRLRGGRGGDELAGNNGNDRINGGTGGDDCAGGAGRNRLRRCETLHGVGIGFPEDPGEAPPIPPTPPPAEVNDAPTVVTTPTSRCYGNGCGLDLFVDDGLTVTDPDSTALSGATVRISTGFTPAEDELAFTDSGPISGTYDDATGALTLTGIASVADYQTALRSVEYHRSGSASGTRTVSFQVTDADGASSNVATRQFFRGVDP